jgi:hypothetical protein
MLLWHHFAFPHRHYHHVHVADLLDAWRFHAFSRYRLWAQKGWDGLKLTRGAGPCSWLVTRGENGMESWAQWAY